MKDFFGILAAVASFLGIIGGVIGMRLSTVIFAILFVLKITGLVTMPWFAWPTVVSVIATPIYMLVGGFVVMFIGGIILAFLSEL